MSEPTECAFGRRSASSATLGGLNNGASVDEPVGHRFTDNVLRKRASYAPKMTADNVIATRVYSPAYTERERLNLHDCSASLHSGPGIGRGSSYNCYQEIARALRLEGAAVGA